MTAVATLPIRPFDPMIDDSYDFFEYSVTYYSYTYDDWTYYYQGCAGGGCDGGMDGQRAQRLIG